MIKFGSKQIKKGLSTVVGSLILIILTIVAALLVGHFVFGLVNGNSHDASLQISKASLINPGGSASGVINVSITVTNNGNDPVSLSANNMFIQTVDGGNFFNNPQQVFVNWNNRNTVTLSPGQSYTFTASIYPTITYPNYGIYNQPNGNGDVPLLPGTPVTILVAEALDLVTGQTLGAQTSTVIED